MSSFTALKKNFQLLLQPNHMAHIKGKVATTVRPGPGAKLATFISVNCTWEMIITTAKCFNAVQSCEKSETKINTDLPLHGRPTTLHYLAVQLNSMTFGFRNEISSWVTRTGHFEPFYSVNWHFW